VGREVPAGHGWLQEIEYDGYGMRARIDGGNAPLLTAPMPSGCLKPKPRHHPGRRYRSGVDQYAPEVEAPAPVHESLRSSGRTL